MSTGKWFLCATLILATGSILIAADAPATQPVDIKPEKPKKLTEPWSFLKTLTPAQTAAIEKIHADAHEQMVKIETKEKDDIVALLTPDQITELKEAEAKHLAERKEKAAERKKEATSKPAG